MEIDGDEWVFISLEEGRLQRKVPPRTIHHTALQCLCKRLLTNAEHRTDLIKKATIQIILARKRIASSTRGEVSKVK